MPTVYALYVGLPLRLQRISLSRIQRRVRANILASHYNQVESATTIVATAVKAWTSLDEPMHAVVGAVISAPAQLLEQALGRAASCRYFSRFKWFEQS